jgi:hypothetical protein
MIKYRGELNGVIDWVKEKWLSKRETIDRLCANNWAEMIAWLNRTDWVEWNDWLSGSDRLEVIDWKWLIE